jgi:hypothetical protein
MKAILEDRGRCIFIGIWGAASLFFGWQLTRGRFAFESPLMIPNLIVLLLCTAALLMWIPNPIPADPSPKPAGRAWFIPVVLLSMIILFPIRTWVGPPLLFGLPIIALVVLLLLKPSFNKREVLFVIFLSLTAGVTGLGAGWITFISPALWSVLQMFLVLTGILAGWGILRANLQTQGVAASRFLTGGIRPASKASGPANGARGPM